MVVKKKRKENANPRKKKGTFIYTAGGSKIGKWRSRAHFPQWSSHRGSNDTQFSQLYLCKKPEVEAGSHSFRFFIKLLFTNEEQVIRTKTALLFV